jgi:hypothetical protein
MNYRGVHQSNVSGDGQTTYGYLLRRGNSSKYVAWLRRAANSSEDTSVNRAASGMVNSTVMFHRQPLSTNQGAPIATTSVNRGVRSPTARYTESEDLFATVPSGSSSVVLIEHLQWCFSSIST